MARIEIYDVCNDYSVDFRETKVFTGLDSLRNYLKSEYGVISVSRIPGANPDRLNLYCFDEYGDLFMQVHEK